MKQTVEMTVHPIPPVYDRQSRILLLGSFPSVRSRQSGFFYGHPRNRLWAVLAAICDEEIPVTVEEKKEFLLRSHIAMWDVIGCCEIAGSSDASIRNVTVNDLNIILNSADIREIYVNGATAYRYYERYTRELTVRAAVCLPSTSPANAAWSLERLTERWNELIGLALKEEHPLTEAGINNI